MTKLLKISFFLIPILWACSSSSDPGDGGTTPDQADFRIVGYLPDYRIMGLDLAVVDNLTDLIYFSIEPEADGSLNVSRLNSDVYFKLNAFRNRNSALKIHIAVGGWGRSRHFAAMVADSITRSDFIQNLAELCLNAGFSGADYDWEFPANATENEAYGRLIRETRTEFDKNSLSVSVALNANQNLTNNAYEALNRINIMSYDHSGRHSTFDQAVLDVNNFISRGIPAGKLCLGIPFYGREITDFSNEMSYNTIMGIYNPGPDEDIVDGIFFNGITTVQKKTQFALNQNLQGVMIWELGQDVVGDASLLATIKSTISP